jgi:hypothetical protein
MILWQWENPWTGKLLTVMHVANNPVQGCFKGKFLAQVNEDSTTFVFDLFSTYPNPLATEPKFADYNPNPTYQAAELFKITVPTAELLNPEILAVSNGMGFSGRRCILKRTHSVTLRSVATLVSLCHFCKSKITLTHPLFYRYLTPRCHNNDIVRFPQYRLFYSYPIESK